MKHIDYMRRCIQLAKQGKGWVNPNPMVGSLIVHQDEIIAEGYHQRFGESHAERNAINSVNDKEILKESTLYVSLEPCSHFGKTPPCADLILSSGIPRVVIAMPDPNPLVAGKGVQKLQDAGVEVILDVLREDAERLNRFFVCFHQKQRPYFIAKWAETADGFIAPIPKAKAFISGEDSRNITHQLRQEVSAVLVGIGTWQTDFPQLNDRIFGGPQPIRIVLDQHKQGDYSKAVANDLITWVLTEKEEYQEGNVFYWALGNYDQHFNLIATFLYQKQINSVIIEGGAATLNQFFNSNLIDEIHVFKHRTLYWKQGLSAPIISNLKLLQLQSLQESDWYTYES